MTNAFISFGYFVGALLGLMVFHMWVWRAWRERRMILVEYYNQHGTNGRPDEEDRDGNDGWLMAMHARMKAQQEPPRIYEVNASSSCCGSGSTAQENRLPLCLSVQSIRRETKSLCMAIPIRMPSRPSQTALDEGVVIPEVVLGMCNLRENVII
ncbi:hypothetical protein FS842_006307 [Serendipita sp. 407]|nr:hypothetical protein FS842_006307 [Serendipita sp. 407]